LVRALAAGREGRRAAEHGRPRLRQRRHGHGNVHVQAAEYRQPRVEIHEIVLPAGGRPPCTPRSWGAATPPMPLAAGHPKDGAPHTAAGVKTLWLLPAGAAWTGAPHARGWG